MADLAHMHDVYSDTHKEARGFRPRHSVAGWTAEDFAREIDALCEEIREDMFPAEGAGWRFDGDPASLADEECPCDSCGGWDLEAERMEVERDEMFFGMTDDEIPLSGEDY